MNKKIPAGIAILSCGAAFLLVGCNPLSPPMADDETEAQQVAEEWEDVLESVDVAPNEVPGHIEMTLSDTLTIDADIYGLDGIDSYSIPNLLVTPHLFEDQEETMDRLLAVLGVDGDGLEFYSGETSDPLDGGGYVQKLEAYRDEDAEDYFYDESYVVRTTYFNGYTSAALPYVDLGVQPWEGLDSSRNYILDLIPGDIDFDFATRDEAAEGVLAALEAMGIDVECSVSVNSCTEEGLEALYERKNGYHTEGGLNGDLDVAGAEDGFEGMEGYLVTVDESYNGIRFHPYFVDSSVDNSIQSLGTQMYGIYMANGIQELSARSIYDVDGEGETHDIVTLRDILENYRQKNELKVLAADDGRDLSEKVIMIQLSYLPIYTGEDAGYEAKLIWWIVSRVGGEDSEMQYQIQTLYDAVSGEELLEE